MLYKIIKNIFRVYFLLFNKITIKGYENIPEFGGIIICPNHIHWLDPVLIGTFIKREITYMAKAELFEIKIVSLALKGIHAFPVKRGTPDLSAIKNAFRSVKQGKVLGIFPEGTRSTDGMLLPAESGVALIAIKTNAPVIPIRIAGSYKIFRNITITIGKPVIFDNYKDKKLSSEEINDASQLIMMEIQKLG